MSDEKPAYVLVDVKITNSENYERYKGLAKPLVEKFGGEYLTRGGEMDVVLDDLWKPTLEKNQGTVSNMGYPIIVENKNEIYNALSKEEIECRPLVAGSMGMQPAWVNLYGESAMPNATVIDKKGMYLPNHQDLTKQNIIDICSIINKEAQ